MAKLIKVGAGVKENPHRKINFGTLRFLIDSYRANDIQCVLYRLSYAGKYIYIKGKTLAGSLIIIADTLASFDINNKDRFKGHLYTHLFSHLMNDDCYGRFRVKILTTAEDGDFYSLLKMEQSMIDRDRYNPKCLNNQVEAYIPQYSEKTDSYGWIPKSAVMNFKKWLAGQERKDLLIQYKK